MPGIRAVRLWMKRLWDGPVPLPSAGGVASLEASFHDHVDKLSLAHVGCNETDLIADSQ